MATKDKEVRGEAGTLPIPMTDMTMRDYFANSALAGLLMSPMAQNPTWFAESGARKAYELADQMIQVRDERP